jgi:hydrogenase maturation protease
VTRPGDVLVLGIGNLLLRDEGVGVHVARALVAEGGTVGGGTGEGGPREAGLPPGARVIDGGTLGLDLLPELESTDALIVIDAVDLDLAAGSIVVLRDGEIGPVAPGTRSVHDIGLGDLLDAARLLDRLPASVTLVGVQVEAITAGLDLTARVAAAVPQVVEVVRREAWARHASALSEVGATS